LLYWEGHYAWIKSFSGFLSDLTKHKGKLHFCKRCFGHSNTEKALEKHQIFCHQPDWCNQAFIFPDQGETLRFTNFWKGDPCPFVIYADCEAVNKKTISKTESTTIYQEQSPSSVGYKIVANVLNWDDQPVVLYHGQDCMERFMTDLIQIEKRCLAHLFPETVDICSEPNLREETKMQFDEAQNCAICHLDFSEDWFGMKYPYFDFSTGRFLGAIHRRCQAERKRRFRIPIFFHNFKGYDSHFVVRGLAVNKERKLEIIGQSMEKYLVIRWGDHLEFKDSLQFLSASLENLVISLLKSGDTNFTNLKAEFPEEQNFKLLLRKGVYPYDWVDDWKKFKFPELPDRDAFYNKLRGEECTTEDWNHAQHVWNAFGCKDFQEYHDLYLKSMPI